jgi:hypothetical protein
VRAWAALRYPERAIDVRELEPGAGDEPAPRADAVLVLVLRPD